MVNHSSDPDKPKNLIVKQELGDLAGVPVFGFRIDNHEEILKLMPVTFRERLGEKAEQLWIRSFALIGLEHTLAHDYSDFQMDLSKRGDPDCQHTGGLTSFGSAFFGSYGKAVAESVKKLNLSDDEKIDKFNIDLIRNIASQKNENLGAFGRWLDANNITDKALIVRVLDEYLHD